MNLLIVSGSLSEGSNSRKMAGHLKQFWDAGGLTPDFIDLRDFDLAICDGGAAYEKPDVAKLRMRFEAADGIVFAVPIYNFDVNAAVKNVIELVGGTMQDKVAGFLCAAGGGGSYMSVMAIANSLMLDFRTVILPRFVYATRDSFDGETVSDPIRERIEIFGAEMAKLTQAVSASQNEGS
ncbi:MAG: NAD(P)H-dependent oxidoreductase [Verrucomicrobiales bacterium]|nr:NAD(P)H-dependent oxidoreductase [Verrucomicrobiales bacterium]